MGRSGHGKPFAAALVLRMVTVGRRLCSGPALGRRKAGEPDEPSRSPRQGMPPWDEMSILHRLLTRAKHGPGVWLTYCLDILIPSSLTLAVTLP